MWPQGLWIYPVCAEDSVIVPVPLSIHYSPLPPAAGPALAMGDSVASRFLWPEGSSAELNGLLSRLDPFPVRGLHVHFSLQVLQNCPIIPSCSRAGGRRESSRGDTEAWTHGRRPF